MTDMTAPFGSVLTRVASLSRAFCVRERAFETFARLTSNCATRATRRAPVLGARRSPFPMNQEL